MDTISAVAQKRIYALVHQQGANVIGAKQKPPKISRPSISRASSEELWKTFLNHWVIFKGTDVPTGQIVSQLWQCFDKDVEEDLFKYVSDISTIDEQELLPAIKQLAVISTNGSVRETEFLFMHQDHEQPMLLQILARIKAKHRFILTEKNVSILIIDEWFMITQMTLLNIS